MCRAPHVVMPGFLKHRLAGSATIGHCCLKGRMRKCIVYIQYTNPGVADSRAF
jgi:hypothetical protein